MAGGGDSGLHDSLARCLIFSFSNRLLALVGFELVDTLEPLSVSGPGGVSLRFLRGANESKSASSSSLLAEDILAESEFVTAGIPFFTMRLLELCELMPDMLVSVEKDENEVLGALLGSCLGI